MAKLLQIKTQDTLNEVLNKLTPSWVDCFSEEYIKKAQVKGSKEMKDVFGIILNSKFIKLSKACAGFKVGTIVSIADIYEQESASNVASLIRYRLANTRKQPTIVEA